MKESLKEAMDTLAVTAMRVKAERDEAVKLLKEALLYSHIGADGPFKTTVRKFLGSLGAIKDYAETMIERDKLARHEGRPDQDLTTRGTPMEAGR